MVDYPLTSIVIVIALLVYLALGIVVGQARGKWQVSAPATSGHPEFEKRNRVHVNTLEQLALFLPAIVLAAPVFGDAITAAIGIVWSIGRIIYARTYYADPAKRSAGFGLTMLPTLALLIVALFGAARSLLA